MGIQEAGHVLSDHRGMRVQEGIFGEQWLKCGALERCGRKEAKEVHGCQIPKGFKYHIFALIITSQMFSVSVLLKPLTHLQFSGEKFQVSLCVSMAEIW